MLTLKVCPWLSTVCVHFFLLLNFRTRYMTVDSLNLPIYGRSEQVAPTWAGTSIHTLQMNTLAAGLSLAIFSLSLLTKLIKTTTAQAQ